MTTFRIFGNYSSNYTRVNNTPQSIVECIEWWLQNIFGTLNPEYGEQISHFEGNYWESHFLYAGTKTPAYAQSIIESHRTNFAIQDKPHNLSFRNLCALFCSVL